MSINPLNSPCVSGIKCLNALYARLQNDLLLVELIYIFIYTMLGSMYVLYCMILIPASRPNTQVAEWMGCTSAAATSTGTTYLRPCTDLLLNLPTSYLYWMDGWGQRRAMGQEKAAEMAMILRAKTRSTETIYGCIYFGQCIGYLQRCYYYTTTSTRVRPSRS